MKQNINEAFSPEESKEIYDKFLSIVGTRRDNLVKKYGSGAEQVAYATAVNQVKKKAANKTEEPMENTKLKEMVKAALSKPLDEATHVKEGKHNAEDFKPYMAKDLNHPNFLKVFIQYPTEAGVMKAYGQTTLSDQDREYNVKKALQIGQAVADRLDSKFNLEDLDVYDNGDGKVIVFAVSDDFIKMNTPPTGLDEDKISEKLKPSMGIESYIKDFIKSDDPKFKGESKKERIKRAVAAYYQDKK